MMTRKEKMLSALIKGETPDIEPITRTEKYLECAIKKSGTADAPEPVTRMDYLLRELADKMSQGGSGAETQTKTVDLSMADGDQTVTPDTGKVLSSVTITKPDTLIPGNIKKDINIGGVVGTLESGGGTQPQLHAPTISISEDTLTITPAANNGDFVTGWKGYSTVGGEEEFSLFGTLPAAVTSLDLTTIDLPASTYRFKATASGTNFQDSADSNVVNYSNIFYDITNNLTNCMSSNSATSVRHGSAYATTLTASSGYTMSGASVTVTMNGTDITSTAYANGVITIAQITGALVVTASAAVVTELSFSTQTSPITSPSSYDNNVFFVNGKFFAMAYNQDILTSVDGTTWVDSGVVSVGLSIKYPAYMVYDGSTYYLMCNNYPSNANFYKSDNGINWVSASITGLETNDRTNIKGLKYFNGKIACFSTNNIYVLNNTSTTPSTWSWSKVERKIDETSFSGNIVFCQNADYAFVFYNTTSSEATAHYNTYVTTDLTNWTLCESALAMATGSNAIGDLSQIVLSNGKFILMVTGSYTSDNVKLFESDGTFQWQEVSAYSQITSSAAKVYRAELIKTAIGVVLIPSNYQNTDKTTVRYAANVDSAGSWKTTSLPTAVSTNANKLTYAYGAGKLVVFVKGTEYSIADA